ncbi:RNA polymerase sigma factor SigJ [Limobrevibacterium gyesilva]|uniref:RNA polymerase sigma factor SigJ n=1 Tax=Limobrevibacterium gyesilva TaxID=2991712 RepID=A0AA42CF91_9PROT|nr:RNA polymerase sigma factor SigJ [Limobrevibacterium gyesilva]MCW3474526.1 RNA polymerase sigma factor SigJ [Limobrevibacterium gyesilva]
MPRPGGGAEIATHSADPFEERRRPLLRLAYRLLGSLAHAEDIVQDAYLHWHSADRAAIDNPPAFLTTVVTRLCLDHLQSARVQQDDDAGAWPPEPLLDARAPGDDDDGVAGALSVALMTTLERLSPPERAAFLLRDAFDLEFDTVAKVLGRSNAECRRLASRAREEVRASPSRLQRSADAGIALIRDFMQASRSGDAGALRKLLTKDAVLVSDGGGRTLSPLNPVRGPERISRFFADLVRKYGHEPLVPLEIVRINGLPGYLTNEPGGVLQTTALEIDGESISAIYIVRNPEDLAHIQGLVSSGRA